jgi:hypothetical protein
MTNRVTQLAPPPARVGPTPKINLANGLGCGKFDLAAGNSAPPPASKPRRGVSRRRVRLHRRPECKFFAPTCRIKSLAASQTHSAPTRGGRIRRQLASGEGRGRGRDVDRSKGQRRASLLGRLFRPLRSPRSLCGGCWPLRGALEPTHEITRAQATTFAAGSERRERRRIRALGGDAPQLPVDNRFPLVVKRCRCTCTRLFLQFSDDLASEG